MESFVFRSDLLTGHEPSRTRDDEDEHEKRGHCPQFRTPHPALRTRKVHGMSARSVLTASVVIGGAAAEATRTFRPFSSATVAWVGSSRWRLEDQFLAFKRQRNPVARLTPV